MQVWDYQIDKNWQPKTQKEWEWFLVRQINYGQFKGIKKENITRFFPKIKELLDPGKKAMLEYFLNLK